jgi:maltose O-acetyltransferase
MLAFVKNAIKMLNGEILTSTLIKRGMKVGKDFVREQGCYIDPTHCFLIQIGDNVTFSIRVTLLAHDASTKKILGFTKIGKIKVGNNVFVGANSTILPNVTIGDNVIIGANSVVVKDVPDNCVVAGNPARMICSLQDFSEKNSDRMNKTRVFSRDYRYSPNLTEDKKEEIKSAVETGIAFIE